MDQDDLSSIRQRQEDELLSLQAILISGVTDLREKEKDGRRDRGPEEIRWQPVVVRIRVEPQESFSTKEPYVWVDLQVKCGRKYPKTKPQEITLSNPKGLSIDVVNSLRKELLLLAQKHAGEEVIFLLVDYIKQFLIPFNEPRPVSFYDEMVTNQRKLEEDEAIRKEKSQELRRQKGVEEKRLLQEELQRKQEAVRLESRLRRESTGNVGPNDQEEDSNYNSDSSSSAKTSRVKMRLKPPSVCNIEHDCLQNQFTVESTLRTPTVRVFQRRNCLFHNTLRNSVEFCGHEVGSFSPVTITECKLRWRAIHPNTGIEVLQKFRLEAKSRLQELSAIEEELNSQLQQLNHPNLVAPIGLKYSLERDHISVNLLQPQVEGIRLTFLPHVLKGAPLDACTVRSYLQQILEGLNYLHQRSIVHQDLKDTNIFIGIDETIRLTGFVLDKKLYELQSSAQELFSNTKVLKENSRPGKGGDIYRLGLLSIWMTSGWRFIFQDLLLRRNLPSYETVDEVRDFVEACSLSDDIQTAERLLCHPFIKSTEARRRSDTESQIEDRNTMKRTETEKRDEQIPSITCPSLLSSQTGHSRLAHEFDVLNKLGSGGFGEVFKVRHRLDQRFYAIKKIPLSSSQRLMNKILREVNLLSRLDHENIVRYYSTWIENEPQQPPGSESSSDTSTQRSQVNVNPGLEVSEAGDFKETSAEDSYDDEEDEGKIFGTSFFVPREGRTFSSDYVMFEGAGEGNEGTPTAPDLSARKRSVLPKGTGPPKKCIPRVVYIQMELCEKNTLRNAIDNFLYDNVSRRRRLFREIVEGLVHIHEQEVIHRDLKPGNIFLDSRDHVKIGDFGLATTEIFNRELPDEVQSPDHLASDGDTTLKNKGAGTGLVGTPFYVAPELSVQSADVTTNKIMYTQKVDLYSLGIIFFEMSYPPPDTGMERTKLLTNLRKKEIVFPVNAEELLSQEEIQLLRLLLQHDPENRPSSVELLKSPCLPPPDMEEKEEQNVIRHVVSNTSSKSYKFLLNVLLKRETSNIQDYVYDLSDESLVKEHKSKRMYCDLSVRRRVFQFVCTTVEDMMRRYGALRFNVPTFMPNLSCAKYEAKDVFRVIDVNGAVIAPPYTLRIPFARYVAKDKIQVMRRFSVERVYRQRKGNYHPRELWECAFDVITPQHSSSPQIIPDSEILHLLKDLVNEFPCLKSKSLTLRLNHMKLLTAIFNYCDISPKHHCIALRLIAESLTSPVKYGVNEWGCEEDSEAVTVATRDFIEDKLQSQKILTDRNKINSLIALLSVEKDSVIELRDFLKTQMRKKQSPQVKALEMALEAVSELRHITYSLISSGYLPFRIKFTPSLTISGSNQNIYSGLICQLEHETIRKSKQSNQNRLIILAVGGRYDDLVSQFQANLTEEEVPKIGAVGLSIGVEKIIKYVIDDEISGNFNQANAIDVAICCVTSSSNAEKSLLMFKEMSLISRELRLNWIRVACLPDGGFRTIEEINKFCFENLVRYAIILKETRDVSDPRNFIYVRLVLYDKERHIEKKSGKIPSSELIEYLKSAFSSRGEGLSGGDSVVAKNESNKSVGWQTGDGACLSLAASTNVHFLPLENKLVTVVRKRYFNTIISLLSSSFSGTSGNCSIEVLALELSYKIVKSIACELELSEDPTQMKKLCDDSVSSLSEKHPRFRKYFAQVLDMVYSIKTENRSPLITLFSYTEMKYIILS